MTLDGFAVKTTTTFLYEKEKVDYYQVMSDNPPRKKFRQTSLIDMFKPVDKDSNVGDNPVSKGESMDLNPKHKESGDAFAKDHSSDVYSANVGDEQIDTESVRKSDCNSPEKTVIEDTHGSCSSSNVKSPQKGIVKTHIVGKFKKKRKHLGNPSDMAGSSSRESDRQWFKSNMASNRKDSKSSPGKSDSSPTKPTWQGSPGKSDSSPTKPTWRGCQISSLQVLGNNSRHVPTVHPSSDHSVMVRLPLPDTGPPDPHPSSYSDIWDQHHVRMPCSPKSLYPTSAGNDALVPRWSVIFKTLQRDMKSVNDLQRVILEYNSRYAEKWNFKGLHLLLEEEFEAEERDHFFQHTLPAIVNLALDLPNLVTQPPPLLTRHSTHSITFSQIQIASLLANAFFCTYPRRNAKGGDTEYASYPDINFNRLFSHKEKRSLEKLKCLLNYFRRVTKKRPDGLVTFTRQYVNESDLPSWETSSHHLPELHLDSSGLIEEKEGLLQVDFANKFIGGGVLGLGCVQEEIRFVLSPEMIVSRLFTQVLDKTEALIITGTEQYNQASGYASNFCWTGSHQDLTKCDVWKRRLCQVVAIDALRFTRPKIQYRPPLIIRELNKVYAGYQPVKGSIGTPIGVATGNWGCGAFNGNPRLKALIQLAACGFAGRSVAYFTFGDDKLRDDLSTMHIFLKENNITVGELVQVLIQYGQREWADGSDLYQYIYHSLGAYDSDTDGENEDRNGSSNKNENTRDVSQKQSTSDSKFTKTAAYHKMTGSPHSSTSHSGSRDSSNNSASSSNVQPEVTKDENLTEEKIVRVLMECDRLVEDQKKKNQENSTEMVEVHKDNKFLIESSDDGSQASRNSTEISKKEMEKCVNRTSKSLSEPVNLLASLDEIDKQSMLHK